MLWFWLLCPLPRLESEAKLKPSYYYLHSYTPLSSILTVWSSSETVVSSDLSSMMLTPDWYADTWDHSGYDTVKQYWQHFLKYNWQHVVPLIPTTILTNIIRRGKFGKVIRRLDIVIPWLILTLQARLIYNCCHLCLIMEPLHRLGWMIGVNETSEVDNTTHSVHVHLRSTKYCCLWV